MAAFCVLAAFLGFITEAVNEMIAHQIGGKANPFFLVLASLFVGAAIVMGIYAQLCQLRRWGQRTHRRLWIGFPVAGITLVAVLPNFFNVPSISATAAPKSQNEQVAQETTEKAVATDNALVKPGWYGELQQHNLLMVVSSYEKDADNGDLLSRIKTPRTLSTGEMISDIPICLAPEFSWTNVVAVVATMGVHEMAIPGRIMTVAEKKAFLDRTFAKPSAPRAGPSAETWYKGM